MCKLNIRKSEMLSLAKKRNHELISITNGEEKHNGNLVIHSKTCGDTFDTTVKNYTKEAYRCLCSIRESYAWCSSFSI